jgi:CBS domain-containing protein
MAETGPQFDLRELFTATTVGELMLTQVPVLSPGETAEDAAAAMRAVNHGSALICEGERLKGIITERDLLKLLIEPRRFQAPLADVMTSSPRTTSVNDRLIEAVRAMDQGGYRRLPVIDERGRPVGIIDVKSVVNFLVEQVPATVYNQAASALLSVREREGA